MNSPADFYPLYQVEFDARQRAEAELATLRAQNAALRDALNTVMRMDVKGHQLQDRLQFSDPGRAILSKARAALESTP